MADNRLTKKNFAVIFSPFLFSIWWLFKSIPKLIDLLQQDPGKALFWNIFGIIMSIFLPAVFSALIFAGYYVSGKDIFGIDSGEK